MEEPRVRREDADEEEDGEDEAGPGRALGKSALQLTAEDVYDIAYVVGRELMALGSDPRVTQLQFTIVRVLELLEALVSEGGLAAEALRLERDSLQQEVRALRGGAPPAGGQVDLGPDKMVVDLTDPNRPRFTLQELKEVLQERNMLKAQLLLAQEELLSYRSGLMPLRESVGGERAKEAVVTRARSPDPGKGEKTIMKKLFAFRSGKQT
uniref:RILP-like protein 2 n=2 Tax=Chinchilla lanigera TaxID=34839 RepID=A0A8C2YP05_CHILA